MDRGRIFPFEVGTTATDAGAFTVGTNQEAEFEFQELYPSFDAAAADAFVQGAAGTQQKSQKKRLAALMGALVIFAAAAGGGLIVAKNLKTKLQCEPAHLLRYAEEATKNVDDFVRLWASSSPAVRDMFCTNYFPRARGVEIVRNPVPAFLKELDECKSVAIPLHEGERKERALHLKFLKAVASAARGRLLGLQALEAFVKNAPSGIFPEEGDSVDLVRYREFNNLLWNLRKLEGQVVKPFPKEHLNELEVATSFRFLRDEFDRQTFTIFHDFLQLVDKTRASVISGGDEGGKAAPVYTFRMLPMSYVFPSQMFRGLLAQFEELNGRRSLPFRKPEEFKVPESAGAAFDLLREAEGGAVEGIFRATQHKDSFVADWIAQAKTPSGDFDLIQLVVFLL
ncbi:hypothetical protein Emag_005943 [Eimeria magna]